MNRFHHIGKSLDEDLQMFEYVGIRKFANKTFANNWRKSWGYIGECPPDFRQLANVQGIYWRKSGGYSPILTKVRWTFASISSVRREQFTKDTLEYDIIMKKEI